MDETYGAHKLLAHIIFAKFCAELIIFFAKYKMCFKDYQNATFDANCIIKMAE